MLALLFCVFLVNMRYIDSLDVTYRSPILLTPEFVRGVDVHCILSDIDGTILPKNQILSDITFKSIKETMKKGYLFFPCTGRTRFSASASLGQRFVELYGISNQLPGVYQQGLTVFGRNGQLIYEKALSGQVISDVVDFCRDANVPVVGYTENKVYCMKRCQKTDRIISYADPIPFEVSEGLQNLHNRGISIQKMVIVDDEPKLEEIRPLIRKELGERVTITSTTSGMLELLPFGASKGYGVQILLDHFNISPEHVMAFGDGENDIEMIELVKYGVAMENANAKLKKHAPYRTGHIDQEAVATVLDSLVIRDANRLST
jgi:Cof subfamily protein (haloacid dehalogenase superfamily)